jgi:hypothetical protein
MWAFSGLAHGAHALPPRERGTMPANPHKLLQLGEIGRTKRPAMSTWAGGGPSGSLCPVFSAISSPQVLTRCGAVKPTPVRPLVADSRSQRSHPDCPQRRSAYRPHRTASEIRCCGSCCARASGAAAHSAVTRSARCALPAGAVPGRANPHPRSPCQLLRTHNGGGQPMETPMAQKQSREQVSERLDPDVLEVVQHEQPAGGA